MTGTKMVAVAAPRSSSSLLPNAGYSSSLSKKKKASLREKEEAAEPQENARLVRFCFAVLSTVCITTGIVLFGADAGKAECLALEEGEEEWHWSRGRFSWSEWDWGCLASRPIVALALFLWLVGSVSGCMVCGLCAGFCGKSHGKNAETEKRGTPKRSGVPPATPSSRSWPEQV